MPYAKSGRRKFQSMDFQIGYIKKGLDLLLDMKKECDWRTFIELIDRMALIDDNYDVLALRGRKWVAKTKALLEDEEPPATKEQASQAVSEMLRKIREGRENVNATTASGGSDTSADQSQPS